MNTDDQTELNSVREIKLAHEKLDKWSAGLQPASDRGALKAGNKPTLCLGVFLPIPHLRSSASICGFSTS